MSRNASGTYSLPAGNPVVTNSVISSTWANTTLADIASALTDSLSRSGSGVMTAGLQLTDGTIGAPGLTFGTETTAGLRRAGAGDFRFTIGGADVVTITSAGLSGIPTLSGTNVWTGLNTFSKEPSTSIDPTLFLSAAIPIFSMRQTGAASNEKVWDFTVFSGQLLFRTATDVGGTNVTWLTVDRTGTTVDQIALAATTVAFGTSNLTGSGTGTVSGAWLFNLTGAGGGPAAVTLGSSQPTFDLRETDAAANNQYWRYTAAAEQAIFSVVNDALSAAVNWLTVDRTGTTVDGVTFPTATNGSFVVGTTFGSTTGIAKIGGSATVPALALQTTTTASVTTLQVWNSATSGDNSLIAFYTDSASLRGSISFNRAGTLTAYNVTSDARLKKNIRNSADAGSVIDQIKVRAFEWKTEGNTLPHWFVAQELAPLVPYAVTVPSEPEGMWSVDPSKLVPLLVKAVQELRMRVAAGGL